MPIGPRSDISETARIHNPALGAFLLWQFGLSFQDEAPRAPPLPAHFLVLPLLLHHTSLSEISTTRPSSGLALFAAKIASNQEDLLAIHERARGLRELTTRSLGVASAAQLISLDYSTATGRSNTLRPKLVPEVPERLKAIVGGAKKLGLWFARLDLVQVASILKVAF